MHTLLKFNVQFTSSAPNVHASVIGKKIKKMCITNASVLKQYISAEHVHPSVRLKVHQIEVNNKV